MIGSDHSKLFNFEVHKAAGTNNKVNKANHLAMNLAM